MNNFIKKTNMEYGWISPQGEIIKCLYGDHISVASRIVETSYPKKNRTISPDDLLLKLGWVKLSGEKLFFYNFDLYENQKLYDMVYDYYDTFYPDTLKKYPNFNDLIYKLNPNNPQRSTKSLF